MNVKLSRILFLVAFFSVALTGCLERLVEAQEPEKSAETNVETQVERAWNAVWTKFYSPETKLFYDFIESYEPGKTLDHLPTLEEVKSLYPHACGYGTGMEDCAISGGVLLCALIDRYANIEFEGGADVAARLAEIKRRARDVAEGLELLATVSGSPGFVARGVSPKAPGVCYINSSRDQVTHLTLALWEYYRSPLIEDAFKPRVADVLFAVADRMTRNVTPENNFDFLCSDGSPCRVGIQRMANVEDHEAARLTAIYATAWDVAKREGNEAKEREYWALWRKWAPETIAQSAHIMENESLLNRMPSYAYLQMQESLNVLWRLEQDDEFKATLAKTSRFIAERVAKRQQGALTKLKTRDLTEVAPSWRAAGGLNGSYRVTWYAPRECGEIALTIAADPAGGSFDAESARVLKEATSTPDFDRISSCGVFHLLGAYEKTKRLLKE